MDPEENNEGIPEEETPENPLSQEEISEQPESQEEETEKPESQIESLKKKILAFIAPLYMKIILSTLAFILFVWGTVTTCSTPHEMIAPRYNIALDPTWGPLELGNRENNMTAFVETILSEIAAKMNFRIAVHHTNTSSLFNEFDKGEYAGIISMMLPPLRSGIPQSIITSNPIYQLGPVLVIVAKSPFTTLEAMTGRVVGLVGENRVDIKIGQHPNVIFTGYSNPSQAFADLNNHKIDGLIVDSFIAKNYIHGLYLGKMEIADVSLTNEGIVLILHKTKGTEKLMEQFNHELKQLRENGTYATLLKTWHVQEE